MTNTQFIILLLCILLAHSWKFKTWQAVLFVVGLIFWPALFEAVFK